MHVERAVVRVRDRTWTFSTTSKCLKRHSPKKSVEGRNIRGWVFPKLLHISSTARQRPLSWKWRMAHVCSSQPRASDLWPTFKLLRQIFYFFFLISFNVIFCSEDSRNLWFLQHVAGRQLTCSPTRRSEVSLASKVIFWFCVKLDWIQVL